MRKILIVDDQPLIRQLLEATLESNEYELIMAGDGAQALELARRKSPDLVILDVVLPGGADGFDVCRQIKSDRATRSARIIMLSAQADDAFRKQGMEAGADDYITKPFSPLQLLDRVSELLG